MAPTAAQLQDMVDEFELRRLVQSYCLAVDRGELELLRSLYRSDARDAHGGFSEGSADAFVAELAAARPYLRSMQHHVTTMTFAIDGDVAEGEVYGVATHTVNAGDRDVDNDPSHQFFSLFRGR